jgi:hypothetical protein
MNGKISVFYPVQCEREKEREMGKSFSFAHFPIFVGSEIQCITPLVSPQARSFNYATFIIT